MNPTLLLLFVSLLTSFNLISQDKPHIQFEYRDLIFKHTDNMLTCAGIDFEAHIPVFTDSDTTLKLDTLNSLLFSKCYEQFKHLYVDSDVAMCRFNQEALKSIYFTGCAPNLQQQAVDQIKHFYTIHTATPALISLSLKDSFIAGSGSSSAGNRYHTINYVPETGEFINLNDYLIPETVQAFQDSCLAISNATSSGASPEELGDEISDFELAIEGDSIVATFTRNMMFNTPNAELIKIPFKSFRSYFDNRIKDFFKQH